MDNTKVIAIFMGMLIIMGLVVGAIANGDFAQDDGGTSTTDQTGDNVITNNDEDTVVDTEDGTGATVTFVATDTQEEITVNNVDLTKQGIVYIYTGNSGVSATFAGKSITLPHSGAYDAGTYTITAQADGYVSSTQQITVNAGVAKSIKVTLVKETVTENPSTTPAASADGTPDPDSGVDPEPVEEPSVPELAYFDITFKGLPSGTVVSADELGSKTASSSGVVTFNDVQEGIQYEYVFTATGYNSKSFTYTLDGSDFTKYISLTKIVVVAEKYKVTIDTESGAKVVCSNGVTQNADSSGNAIFYYLTKGTTYTFTVSKTGYYTRSVTVTPTADTVKSVTLEKEASSSGGSSDSGTISNSGIPTNYIPIDVNIYAALSGLSSNGKGGTYKLTSGTVYLSSYDSSAPLWSNEYLTAGQSFYSKLTEDGSLSTKIYAKKGSKFTVIMKDDANYVYYKNTFTVPSGNTAYTAQAKVIPLKGRVVLTGYMSQYASSKWVDISPTFYFDATKYPNIFDYNFAPASLSLNDNSFGAMVYYSTDGAKYTHIKTLSSPVAGTKYDLTTQSFNIKNKAGTGALYVYVIYTTADNNLADKYIINYKTTETGEFKYTDMQHSQQSYQSALLDVTT